MGKIGRTIVTTDEIQQMVKRVAAEINQTYGTDFDQVLFVGVMKGAYLWMADLLRALNADVQMDYVRVASYEDDHSTGEVQIIHDLKTDIRGKKVVLLDEVIDSGLTLQYLQTIFLQRGALDVKRAVAVDKRPQAIQEADPVEFVGTMAPDEFLIGYGMDYNNHYRNLPYIAVLESEVQAV